MLRARRPPKTPILAPLILVLLFAAGIFFTGCTSLVRGFNRVRAEMTKPATDQEINNYGAFFTDLYDLTKRLMSSMNVELEFQINRSLRKDLQPTSPAAPGPAPVETQDLGAPPR